MLIAVQGLRKPMAWAIDWFSPSDLNNAARTRRLVKFMAAMAGRPGASVPAMFDDPGQVKAAYRFLDTREATPDSIQSGPRRRVREAMERRGGIFLCLEDTTEISLSGRALMEGLGPVGPGRAQGHAQGYLLHSTLVLAEPEDGLHEAGVRRRPMRVMGLADQQFYARKPRPAAEKRLGSRAGLKRERESKLWTDSTRRLGPPPMGTRVIRIADRGADIYESLSEYIRAAHGFVVRAAYDRRLQAEPGTQTIRTLFAKLRGAPSLGEFDLYLRHRPGEPARWAVLSVAAAQVALRSPQRPGKAAGSLPAIRCWAIRVWEAAPPDGVKKPLEWYLLTSEPAEDFEAAREGTLRYASRWVVEEFHKALKMGMGAERLQLETAARHFAAVAMMSEVATGLIKLREQLRIDPDAPAEYSGLESLELAVLRADLKRPVATIRDAALAVGRLGGHMNRKGDGMPGWITLWRGMNRLRLEVKGATLALELSHELSPSPHTQGYGSG